MRYNIRGEGARHFSLNPFGFALPSVMREGGKEMENEKTHAASESEVLETLTKILRREETEDTVVKLRDETKTVGDDGKTYVERGERTEIIKVRPKLSDVIKAAELIGKSYGMFSDRVEGSIALPLIICGEDDLK